MKKAVKGALQCLLQKIKLLTIEGKSEDVRFLGCRETVSETDKDSEMRV